MSAVLAAGPFRHPPGQDRITISFLIALATHALLFGAMTWAVQWRTQPQAPVVAELWGALPPPAPIAAPEPVVVPPPLPKPEPEPTPREPDIALKQEKKAPPKVEEKKVETKKVEAKKDAAKAEPVESAELRRIREQLAAAGPTAPAGTTGPAAATGGGAREATWFGQISGCIRQHLSFPVPEGTPTSVYAEFRVELLPDASVAGVRLVKASGLPGYDAAAENAIRSCNPFPRARDGTLPMRSVPVVMRPADR